MYVTQTRSRRYVVSARGRAASAPLHPTYIIERRHQKSTGIKYYENKSPAISPADYCSYR